MGQSMLKKVHGGIIRARDHGKMESKPTQEMIANGKNDVKLQTEAR